MPKATARQSARSLLARIAISEPTIGEDARSSSDGVPRTLKETGCSRQCSSESGGAPTGAAVWRAVRLFADADGWQVDHITGDTPVAGL
jgi:hypothetical protein